MKKRQKSQRRVHLMDQAPSLHAHHQDLNRPQSHRLLLPIRRIKSRPNPQRRNPHSLQPSQANRRRQEKKIARKALPNHLHRKQGSVNHPSQRKKLKKMQSSQKSRRRSTHRLRMAHLRNNHKIIKKRKKPQTRINKQQRKRPKPQVKLMTPTPLTSTNKVVKLHPPSLKLIKRRLTKVLNNNSSKTKLTRR